MATLYRDLGDLDAAEDAAQEAATVALTRWLDDGIPDRPGAWITTVAPAIRHPQSPIWFSFAACTSFRFAADPAAERQGKPIIRASCPAANEAWKWDGVPKAGAPDFISTFEVKVP